MKKFVMLLSTLFVICITTSSHALRFLHPESGNDIVGNITTTVVSNHQKLFDIARRYDIGFFELLEANPGIDPENLPQGTVLIVPIQFVLPPAKREGIVINLASMRLFYFPKKKDYFYTYPIGIGKENWQTPLGTLSIIQKTKDPIWFVPNSIYQYRKEHGVPTPKIVKAGPDNPLGHYELRLSNPTYLIHGTNDPTSVGVRSSAGCIHLYPEDISELFANVPLHEKVVIINQPYLLGWSDNQLAIEAHLPLAELREKYLDANETFNHLITKIAKTGIVINKKTAVSAINSHLGIPIKIGTKTQV